MNAQTNLGVVTRGKGDLRVVDLGVPEPTSNQALVRIAFGGICGSDLHYWLHGSVGDAYVKAPLTLGHEVVGTVVQAAEDGTGPTVGARVAVHPATPGASTEYPVGRPNISPSATYLGSARHFPHTAGAFAQVVALPTRMLRALPDGLSLRDAAVVEPASVAWHAVALAGEVRGKRVLVIGCGPIGALVLAVLRRARASEIIAVDVYPGPLERAASLGASQTILASNQSAITDVDADVAIESSGSPEGLNSAVAGLARGGRGVIVGMPPGGPQAAPPAVVVAPGPPGVRVFSFH